VSRKFLTPLNILNSASDPGTANIGDIYYNTSTGNVRVYTASGWVNSAGSGSSAGPTGPTGPAGPALIEVDGGSATSNYGGITSINAGTATG